MIRCFEAAKILRVSMRRVEQFAAAGRLPSSRFAGRLAFERQDVLDFARIERRNGRPKSIQG